MKGLLLGATAAIALTISYQAAPARAQGAVAIAGSVSSAEEGAMEGVLVSAKRDGSTVTVTVVSDDKGKYSFPAARLEPGNYKITIRAAGYDLDGTSTADVAAGKVTNADIKLKKTRNLAAQLTNAEWLDSVPGTHKQKALLSSCNGCHSYQRIFRSAHQPEEWAQIFRRMGSYSPGSTPV